MAAVRGPQRTREGYRRPAWPHLLCLLCLASLAACGKKGPPLAPLRLVPAAVGEVAARRTGDEIRLRFTVPSANADGPGPVELDRIEIFALSVPAGAATPPVTDILEATHRVGEIVIKPPPAGEAAVDKTDPRPAPGEAAIFTERVTTALLPPPGAATVPATDAPRRPADPARSAGQAGAAAAAPTATAPPAYPVRVYVIRGLTRSGRPGPPSSAISVPLVEPPSAPSAVTATHTENAIRLEWTPPASETSGSAIAFNVYRADSDAAALNQAPLTKPVYEQAGVAFGEEQCFVVRGVASVGGVPVEGGGSPRACVTPTDVFPPAAPKNLTVIASAGAINLAWEANAESDLAGYIILRAEAGGATLQQLTPSAVRENTYTDTTVKPGVTYTYAVVAVDSATPPNMSAQSASRTETAR
jgi:predicted small lipoprotein YifL